MMKFMLAMIIGPLVGPALRLIWWTLRTMAHEAVTMDPKDRNEMLLVTGCALVVCGTLMAPALLGIKI